MGLLPKLQGILPQRTPNDRSADIVAATNDPIPNRSCDHQGDARQSRARSEAVTDAAREWPGSPTSNALPAKVAKSGKSASLWSIPLRPRQSAWGPLRLAHKVR